MNIRKLIAFSFLTLASVGFNAQVEIDKPVQLTGADGDRRVTNLETPVDGSDAANKDYVDAQVASVSGGTSNLDFTISANTADVYLAPGLSNSATPLVLSLAYVSGVPAPVGIIITGLPAGVTYNLTPSGGFPSFTSSVVFTAAPETALGDSEVTITAMGGATPETTTITFHVLPKKRVFVTANATNGNLGGLSGADSRCNTDASNAGLGGTWKAWLSTSSVHAKDRIADGLYTKVDGVIIAASKADLTDGSIQSDINLTASGATPGDWPVWTGTEADGTSITNKHCSNWTSSSGGTNGRIGATNVATGAWSSAHDASSWSGCATSFGRLFCFED